MAIFGSSRFGSSYFGPVTELTVGYGIDALLIDSGPIVGLDVPAVVPMRSPLRRAEQVSVPSASRVDE